MIYSDVKKTCRKQERGWGRKKSRRRKRCKMEDCTMNSLLLVVKYGLRSFVCRCADRQLQLQLLASEQMKEQNSKSNTPS